MGKKHASQYANFGWLLIFIITRLYTEIQADYLKPVFLYKIISYFPV